MDNTARPHLAITVAEVNAMREQIKRLTQENADLRASMEGKVLVERRDLRDCYHWISALADYRRVEGLSALTTKLRALLEDTP